MITFLDVTFALRERALLNPSARGVAPRTSHEIPGAALRGMIASACTQDELSILVANEGVWCAPALPLFQPTNTPVLAYPAARSTLVDNTVGARHGTIHDARDLPNLTDVTDWTTPAGPTITDRGTLRPAPTPTTVIDRMRRSDTTDTTARSGPFTETVLAPGTEFKATFRIVDERAPDILIEVLNRSTLTVGASSDGAFGGDLVVLGHRVHEHPWPEPQRNTAEGETLDLVLVTPALVRSSWTGDYDPSAVGDALVESIDRHTATDGAAHPARPASVAATRVGGFNRMFGGPRPEHWAADAGSVVSITTPIGIDADTWTAILTNRIGDRRADGYGLVRMSTPATRATTMTVPTHRSGTAAVRLPDGTPIADDTPVSNTPAVQSLQDRLFRGHATPRITDDARVIARTATSPPSRHTLSRLLAALPSPNPDTDTATAELDTLIRTIASFPDRGVAHSSLIRCRLRVDPWALPSGTTTPNTITLARWIADASQPNGTAPLDPYDLVDVALITDTTANDTAQDWIKNHRPLLAHLKVRRLLRALRTSEATS